MADSDVGQSPKFHGAGFLREMMHDIKLLQDDILSTPDCTEKLIQLRQLIRDFNKLFREQQSALDTFEESIDHNKDTSNLGISKDYLFFERRQFNILMKEYTAIRDDYSKRLRDRLCKIFELAGKDATDEEINQMLDTDRTACVETWRTKYV